MWKINWQNIKGKNVTSASPYDIIMNACGQSFLAYLVLSDVVYSKVLFQISGNPFINYGFWIFLYLSFIALSGFLFLRYLRDHEERFKWATVVFFMFMFCLSVFMIIVGFAG